MWFLFLLCTALPAAVLSQDRLILKNGKHPCEGYVEIYHNGTWGYVGDTAWNKNTEKVVCSSINCGNHSSSVNTFIPNGKKIWLNEIKCTGNEKHLWECGHPGWGISSYRKDTIKKITCSNKPKISLDGFKCAGFVQYSTSQAGRDGPQTGYYCDEGWGEKEAELVCRSLDCDTFKEILPLEYKVKEGFGSAPKMKLSCSNDANLDNLWQCTATSKTSCNAPASVICKGHQRWRLKNGRNNCQGQLEKEETDTWTPLRSDQLKQLEFLDVCRQMFCGHNVSVTVDNGKKIQLECSDNVSVVLKKNNEVSKCYGDVHIKVNATSYSVCGSTWTKEAANVVCRELNCGKAVSHRTTGPGTGIMDNVKCSGDESSLWHCRARREGKAFSCSSKANVVCSASINVRLADGPGKCAGRLEILHNGKWQKVANEGWTDANSDKVCKQLGCGKKRKSATSDKFTQGSGGFSGLKVTCTGTSDISECLYEDTRSSKEAIAITCEEHKVVFLKGEQACSGKVGIEHNGGISWLSVSNDTWNQESANAVCQQMHCGSASSFTSEPNNPTGSIWGESYTCSSSSTSLFDCRANSKQPGNTIASVICSGNITVELSENCWGTVNVTWGGKSGGVCSDAWTSEKSNMLCKDLGCGNQALNHENNLAKNGNIRVKSVHMTAGISSLAQCNFVEADESTSCSPASVICPGSIKVRLNSTRYKCSGNVEVLYGGQWLPVFAAALADKKTQNVICEELKCGQAIKTLDYVGLISGAISRVISSIQCSTSNPKSLSDCNVQTETGSRGNKLGGLQCSNWKKMELKSDSACSGAVFVYSEGKRSAVSSQGWSEAEGKLLCQDLQCGGFQNSPTQNSQKNPTQFDILPNIRFSCNGPDPKNIWDCEKPVSTTPPQPHLFVECTDEPSVTLTGKCSGEVRINGIGVCSENWNMKYADLVCQEQSCGNAVSFKRTMPKANARDQYQHVICEDYHYKLGQCNRFKGECKGDLVYVHCVDGIQFSTTEKCGGQIKVQIETRGKWEKVYTKNLPTKFKKMLCEELSCDGHNASVPEKKIKADSMTKSLDCSPDHNSIKHCVTDVSNSFHPAAEIYCYGYVDKGPPVPPASPVIPIIIGVALVLLVIVIILVARAYMKRNAQSSQKIPPIMMSGREEEFEEFEEFESGKMESFRHGRYRREAEFITESEDRSSLSYDDIDQAEAQPLRPQDASAEHHSAPTNQSSDGENYEVEDPLENYDDIRDNPDVTQTEAEVHESAQAAPENVGTAPPEQEKGSSDYLVPGQDG